MEDLCETSSIENTPTSVLYVRSKEKKFSCTECGKSFAYKSQLEKHLRVHTQEKPYTCSICEKRFSYKSSLIPHMRVHTKEKPFLCSECGKGFSHKPSLKAHLRTHTDEKLFLCKICGKSYKHASSFHDHVKTHLNITPHACPLCDKVFARSSDVTIHMRVHTTESFFKCIECGKEFARKFTLQNHMRTHTLEKPYTCTECGKSFRIKKTLTTHMRLHTQERPYSCSVCEKSFQRKDTLDAHMRVHTGKFYTCSTCRRKFTRSANLNRHMKIHIEGRRIGPNKNFDMLNFTSSGSDKSLFISAGHDKCSRNDEASDASELLDNDESCMLSAQTLKHDPETSSNLFNSNQNHMRTHTLEKPYTCTECGKSFRIKKTLTTHMRLHTQERPYSCSVCEKSFQRKDTLDAHMRVHTGKFYTCSTCRRKFTRSANLNRHMKIHIEGRRIGPNKNFDMLNFTSSGSDKSLFISAGHDKCSRNDEASDASELLDNDEGCMLSAQTLKHDPETSSNLFNSNQNHMRTHTLEKPYTCTECGKSFRIKKTLTTHMRLHTQERPYSCSVCEKSFQRKDTLDAHMRVHTGKFYTCSTCRRKFTRSANLNRHMKIHIEGRRIGPNKNFDMLNFTSSGSDKSLFISAGHDKCSRNDEASDASELLDNDESCMLSAQTLKHDPETSSNLFNSNQNHMRTHTLEKPYTCTECGKSFRIKKTLTTHMRLHTQERPYSCSVCEKSFQRKDTLDAHMRVHTGKFYTCSTCRRKFTRSANLNRHMKIHIEGRRIGPNKNFDMLNFTSSGSDKSLFISAGHDKCSRNDEASDASELLDNDESCMLSAQTLKHDPETSSNLFNSNQKKEDSVACLQKLDVEDEYISIKEEIVLPEDDLHERNEQVKVTEGVDDTKLSNSNRSLNQ